MESGWIWGITIPISPFFSLAFLDCSARGTSKNSLSAVFARCDCGDEGHGETNPFAEILEEVQEDEWAEEKTILLTEGMRKRVPRLSFKNLSEQESNLFRNIFFSPTGLFAYKIIIIKLVNRVQEYWAFCDKNSSARSYEIAQITM